MGQQLLYLLLLIDSFVSPGCNVQDSVPILPRHRRRVASLGLCAGGADVRSGLDQDLQEVVPVCGNCRVQRGVSLFVEMAKGAPPVL